MPTFTDLDARDPATGSAAAPDVLPTANPGRPRDSAARPVPTRAPLSSNRRPTPPLRPSTAAGDATDEPAGRIVVDRSDSIEDGTGSSCRVLAGVASHLMMETGGDSRLRLGSRRSAVADTPGPVPISLDQAMKGAAEGTDRGWKLVSISNTGRFGELAYANWREPTDPMTRSEGLAGQWVVEYFKPKSHKSDGAVCYPARRVLVMSSGADALADGSVCPASPLVALPSGTATHLDAARKLAATTLGMPFDAVAVSTPDVDGTPVWRFQFYGNSVGDASVVVVSIDGRTVIPRESVGQ